jgi:hypothetical protein
MGSRNLYEQVVTEKSPDEIKEAIKTAFRSVGGTMQETPSGVEIRQGVNGVSFAFSADFKAQVNLRQVKEKAYEIECAIQWKLNALSIICLVVGFFVFGILWIVPALFLFIRPEDAYGQALHRVQTYLE